LAGGSVLRARIDAAYIEDPEAWTRLVTLDAVISHAEKKKAVNLSNDTLKLLLKLIESVGREKAKALGFLQHKTKFSVKNAVPYKQVVVIMEDGSFIVAEIGD
jgi:hypothetical protein